MIHLTLDLAVDVDADADRDRTTLFEHIVNTPEGEGGRRPTTPPLAFG
jgi:hypothetical protein